MPYSFPLFYDKIVLRSNYDYIFNQFTDGLLILKKDRIDF